ncbi:MAG: methyltransferase [Rhodospirillaceae bacterium]|nr:methyltransferase [Rhodospirillaceae bacterium]
MSVSQDSFITDSTTIDCAPLVPEIRLQLATEVTPLWQATADSLEDANIEPPFWAFAWPGGQALARHILDHPDIVRGKRVLDIAAGSGIVAIAAAKSGARSVTANDIDPLSLTAITLNAALNNVTLAMNGMDLTLESPPARWDVILAGDVFYERAMASSIAQWLSAAARAGGLVLACDPGRAYLPQEGVESVATYDVPTSLDLEDNLSRITTIWSFTP